MVEDVPEWPEKFVITINIEVVRDHDQINFE
jgi:hypothetical protein